MNEQRRNTAVGIFVIIGFVLLAVLIIKFSDLAGVAKGGYPVKVSMADARGIMSQKIVYLYGKGVGEVDTVDLAEGGVEITLRIESKVDIPRNTQLIASPSGFGDVFLNIELPIGPGGVPEPPARDALPKDGTARLRGAYGATQLLPDPLIRKLDQALDQFKDLGVVIGNLRELTTPRTPEEVARGAAPPNLASAIAEFNRTMVILNGDDNPANLKETMKKLSTDLEEARKTLEIAQTTFSKAGNAIDKASTDLTQVKDNTNKLLVQLTADGLKLSNLLDTFTSLGKGLQEGEGTLGKLLKSDELHKEMLLLVIQMNQTMQDISRLSVKLEKEGFMRKGG
jgi:phospholipid/cholesterol/gamma-HCH transport system substrate-binding protein